MQDESTNSGFEQPDEDAPICEDGFDPADKPPHICGKPADFEVYIEAGDNLWQRYFICSTHADANEAGSTSGARYFPVVRHG
jgi:hypothetical protein